jgi:hypothetical protein
MTAPSYQDLTNFDPILNEWLTQAAGEEFITALLDQPQLAAIGAWMLAHARNRLSKDDFDTEGAFLRGLLTGFAVCLRMWAQRQQCEDEPAKLLRS